MDEYRCRHCGEVHESKRELFNHLREDECGWKGIDPIKIPADEIHDREKEEIAIEWGGG